MNISPSACSSGYESGWTMYLDQYFNSTDQYSKTSDKNHHQRKGTYVNEEEDDYDLSMISDASSGPPQFDVSILGSSNLLRKRKQLQQNQAVCWEEKDSN
ncbi:unnamed protein product [Fraxinus pennsylvanica]|uniref:Uncharacterized protein n=1 Tax=Fraxinus pennsylvanica TaxID=56036 RepID=A0AAD2E1D2_9LAMI|nr:unnamed protein product [Fraxinus pennsylvanica]